MGSSWERLRLLGVPGRAILGAAPQGLSVRDQDSAGTPLAATGSQDLSWVPCVQTRGDPQPDVGSGPHTSPWLAEQALHEAQRRRTHPGPAGPTV